MAFWVEREDVIIEHEKHVVRPNKQNELQEICGESDLPISHR